MMSEAYWGDGSGNREPLYIRFYIAPHQNQPKSTEAGRPIFEDREWIEIAAPGNKNSQLVRIASDMDKKRFAQQYAAWKLDNQSEGRVGTPLEAWPQVTRALVEELRYFKITTVEHLASVSDSNIGKMPGLHTLREQAKAFLQVAKDNSVLTKMQAELETRDSQIAALMEQVRSLGEDMAKMAKLGTRKSA